MTSSTLFTDAMALTSSGDGVYDGVLNEHWTIGPKIHGGAMLALCANAARAEFAAGLHDSEVEPIAVSGSFLWAPDPGPMRVITTVRKRGRRVSLIDVELRQGVRTALRAAITMGTPEHHLPPLSPSKLGSPVGQPGSAAHDAGAAARSRTDRAGTSDGGYRALAHGCDIRPSLTTFTRGRTAGRR